jgi:HD-like signal output (HDOD) protein
MNDHQASELSQTDLAAVLAELAELRKHLGEQLKVSEWQQTELAKLKASQVGRVR